MKTIPHLGLLTEKIQAFERSGEYRQGFEALATYWKDFHDAPDTSGLSKPDEADLLLRCGVLAGFLGRIEDSLSAQENSKNLLTAAREYFLEVGDLAHVVEAENGIAVAYVRKGEFREAEIWIESSFSRDLSTDHFARIQSFLVKSLILLEMNKYEDAQQFLQSVEQYFQEFDDDYLNGCYAVNVGIALRNQGRLPEAMQMYTLGRHHFHRCGNNVFLATVENNLANIYRIESRFDLAHQAIDRAIELHQKAGDLSRFGFAFDTKALIFLDERRFSDALEVVQRGIDILNKTEFSEFLVETLFTKIKIQIAENDLAGSAITFSEAAEILRRVQGSDRLTVKANEFEELVKGGLYAGLSRILTEKVIPGQNLELELAPSLSGFTEYDAIWIRNQHFESLGLEIGSLGLVVADEVVSGDLVAVAENGSEEVICGFLGNENGNIVISVDDSEPFVFQREAVEIIGRIVGYAKPESRVDGRLKVEPLKSDPLD